MTHRPHHHFVTHYRRVVNGRTTFQIAIYWARDKEEAAMMAVGDLTGGTIVADVKVDLLETPAAQTMLRRWFAHEYIGRLMEDIDGVAQWAFTVTTT